MQTPRGNADAKSKKTLCSRVYVLVGPCNVPSPSPNLSMKQNVWKTHFQTPNQGFRLLLAVHASYFYPFTRFYSVQKARCDLCFSVYLLTARTGETVGLIWRKGIPDYSTDFLKGFVEAQSPLPTPSLPNSSKTPAQSETKSDNAFVARNAGSCQKSSLVGYRKVLCLQLTVANSLQSW